MSSYKAIDVVKDVLSTAKKWHLLWIFFSAFIFFVIYQSDKLLDPQKVASASGWTALLGGITAAINEALPTKVIAEVFLTIFITIVVFESRHRQEESERQTIAITNSLREEITRSLGGLRLDAVLSDYIADHEKRRSLVDGIIHTLRDRTILMDCRSKVTFHKLTIDHFQIVLEEEFLLRPRKGRTSIRCVVAATPDAFSKIAAEDLDYEFSFVASNDPNNRVGIEVATFHQNGKALPVHRRTLSALEVEEFLSPCAENLLSTNEITVFDFDVASALAAETGTAHCKVKLTTRGGTYQAGIYYWQSLTLSEIRKVEIVYSDVASMLKNVRFFNLLTGNLTVEHVKDLECYCRVAGRSWAWKGNSLIMKWEPA